MNNILERINEYLGNGGFFNPESMDHNAVRTLLMDCRDYIKKLEHEHDDMKAELKDLLIELREMPIKMDFDKYE